MKNCLVLLSILLTSVVVNSQERKSLTMPYEGGTLTFQYYEKDGVKVPDGHMEFIKGNYSEKGENKDGYREGTWIAKTVRRTSSVTTEYNYHEGMLEGPTYFKYTETNNDSKHLQKPDATYNFHKGRLIGKNKIVDNSDTIYCEFADEGKRTGVWKFVRDDKTMVLEYNDNPSLQVAYELDVLGQKKEQSFNNIQMQFVIPFLFFNNLFKEIPFALRDKKRPELPTLCENKYGYIYPLEEPKKEDDWW